MPTQFETTLSEASQRILDASIVVVSNMSQSQHIENETLWEIQTEVVWTLLGSLMRGIYSGEGGGPDARNAIQDELVPILVNDMLDSGFDWPPNSEDLRAVQYQSLLQWFDQTESDNANTIRYMSPQTAFFQMMLDGSIPEDSLVGRLCRRVARATDEMGNSELIQSLFLQAAESHMKADIYGLTEALIEAEKTRQA
ncbi:MAG: hypothetical protein GEU75_05030 [Dehalococcoidia bacterium]|nr:hypothetical protein [Dehalococcoidia bacterium]